MYSSLAISKTQTAQTSGLGLRRPGKGMLLPLLPQEVAGRRGVSAQWWGSASLSLKDPKGKVSPESGGLSRTVKKFSHNQIHKQSCNGQQKGPLSSKEMEGGRERGGRSDS